MKTIVVGYDGSEPARRALERAATLAQAFGSRLLAVAVVETPTIAGPEVVVVIEEEERRRKAVLDEAGEDLAARGVDAELRLEPGDPAHVLVDLAEEVGADLIVTGTGEPGFLERLFGGSVSESVVRRARCDVLVVH